MKAASPLELPKGSIVVFDKGFINYPWFRLLGEKGVFFVTRLKRNAVYKILERRPVDRTTGVTSDHIIEVVSGKKTSRLRRVGYHDLESGKHYEFLTNHFRLVPKTIASRLELSVQQLFQLVQFNLLGRDSLEELLNPRRRKNENSYNLSLLSLTA